MFVRNTSRQVANQVKGSDPIVSPCAPWTGNTLIKNCHHLLCIFYGVSYSLQTPDHRTWGWSLSLRMMTRKKIVFESTPLLRNIVPFLPHLLVATNNCHTSWKFGFQFLKFGGPGWKTFLRSLDDPADDQVGSSIVKSQHFRRIIYTLNIFFFSQDPQIRSSESNFSWRVAVVKSSQKMEWNNISKKWRGCEILNFPRHPGWKAPPSISTMMCSHF